MIISSLVVNIVKWLIQFMILIQSVAFVTEDETYNSVYIALVVLLTLKAYNFVGVIVKWDWGTK